MLPRISAFTLHMSPTPVQSRVLYLCYVGQIPVCWYQHGEMLVYGVSQVLINLALRICIVLSLRLSSWPLSSIYSSRSFLRPSHPPLALVLRSIPSCAAALRYRYLPSFWPFANPVPKMASQAELSWFELLGTKVSWKEQVVEGHTRSAIAFPSYESCSRAFEILKAAILGG